MPLLISTLTTTWRLMPSSQKVIFATPMPEKSDNTLIPLGRMPSMHKNGMQLFPSVKN